MTTLWWAYLATGLFVVLLAVIFGSNDKDNST